MYSEDEIRADYEFWLGHYQKEQDYWKSGIVHAYHNVICLMEGKITDCPCHVCISNKGRKTDASR